MIATNEQMTKYSENASQQGAMPRPLAAPRPRPESQETAMRSPLSGTAHPPVDTLQAGGETCQGNTGPSAPNSQSPQIARQQYQQQAHDPASSPAGKSSPPRQEQAAEPPAEFIRPRKKTGKFIGSLHLLMSLSFFVAIALAGMVIYSRHKVDQPGPLTEKAIFEVGKGQGLGTISARLQKDGIISDRRIFAMNAVASKKAKKLKAGKYAIPARASMQDVLDILVRGKAIHYRITLPEGWTSEQIVKALEAHPQLKGSIDSIPPEGSLMPETFQFSEGEERKNLIAKMMAAQKKVLAELWQKRQPGLPFKTPQEALVLASIVEKETGRADERRRVAGVFINRMRRGMKLQSDPTIIYGLVGGKGKLGRPLLRSEINRKTAYNTYHISGLPPTPIANPGRKSIEAVLNPEQTDDLYFVADGSGGHAFAPNLKLHNKNVREWRKIEAERRREARRRQAEAEQERLAAEKNKKQTKAQNEALQVVPVAGISIENNLSQSGEKQAVAKGSITLPVRNPRRR